MNPNSAKITDFREFTNYYNAYKDAGMIPKEIAQKMKTMYDCKSTCYFDALRACRKNGLIKDSYAENKAAAIERQKQSSKKRLETCVVVEEVSTDNSQKTSNQSITSRMVTRLTRMFRRK